MPDYKEMYITLFKETTKAISILQTAQQRTEEIYISDDTENNLILLKPHSDILDDIIQMGGCFFTAALEITVFDNNARHYSSSDLL